MKKNKQLLILLASALLLNACGSKKNEQTNQDPQPTKKEITNPQIPWHNSHDWKDTLYVLSITKHLDNQIKANVTDKKGFESTIIRDYNHPVLETTERGDEIVIYYEYMNQYHVIENITQKSLKEKWLKGKQR